MPDVLASTLSETQVLQTNGEPLGSVVSVTMHVETGALDSIIVDPVDDYPDGYQTTERGRVSVPAERVQGLNDYLVVDPPAGRDDSGQDRPAGRGGADGPA
jgi:sporulation protein YlmC with PRC-barrel domain